MSVIHDEMPFSKSFLLSAQSNVCFRLLREMHLFIVGIHQESTVVIFNPFRVLYVLIVELKFLHVLKLMEPIAQFILIDFSLFICLNVH